MNGLTLIRSVSCLAAVTAIASCGGAETKTVTVEAPANKQEKKPRTSAPPESDCDAKGINKEQLKTGTCEEEGQTFTVVNRSQTLRLEELNAEVVSRPEITKVLTSDIGTERANGTYFILTLRVTNKLDSPVQVTTGSTGEQFALVDDDDRVYTEDFEASNQIVDQSFLSQGEDIQPGTSQTGKVVFDVPAKVANLSRSKANEPNRLALQRGR